MEYNTGQLQQTPPKNWLVESILVTLFCCMPFGIAGIVYAAQVNQKFSEGDYEGAMRASKEAAKWTKISFWIGVAFISLNVIFFILFGLTIFYSAGVTDF